MPATTQNTFIGLGANQDEPARFLAQAKRELENIPAWQCRAWSSLYWTEPQGVRQQQWFANQVAWLQLPLDATPQHTVEILLEIETRLGRVRGQRWGPRCIDLDLLVLGEQCSNTAQAHVPHPRLAERAFVLVPLAELAPELILPGFRQSTLELLAKVNYRCEGNTIWQT
ncbi:MAG: 2-amino-4-hydroxy-6-hydroxymethyldihydropteridine diphosphokinase [Thermodesulfobacteriota bacterium]